MSQIATHDGTVTKVENNKVHVEMHVVSACSSCAAHEKCAFVDKADKIVEVETSEWQNYTVGDRVVVSVNESLGLTAVLLAYLVPALILVASVVLLSLFTNSEALAALLPLLFLALYFLLLYRLRDRLQKKFSFEIKQAE